MAKFAVQLNPTIAVCIQFMTFSCVHLKYFTKPLLGSFMLNSFEKAHIDIKVQHFTLTWKIS